MSGCCYCSLQSIKRRAKEEGKEVTVVYNARWGMGGANVYVHPKGVNLEGVVEDSPECKKYWVSWMMKITDRCAC